MNSLEKELENLLEAVTLGGVTLEEQELWSVIRALMEVVLLHVKQLALINARLAELKNNGQDLMMLAGIL